MRRIVLCIALAACSSNNALPNGPADSPPNAAGVAVPLKVFIPHHIGRLRSKGTLHQLFIAANSGGIEVAIYPHGSRSKLLASFTGNLSSSSPDCKAVAGGRTCTFELRVSPGGPYDFLFGTFDEAPVRGLIPNGATQLGSAIATAKIVAGKANALKITVGGIVARAFVYAPQPALFHAIASNTEHLVAGAMDPDGNIIASDGYVNANGSPVTVSLAADTHAGNTVALTPARFSAPPVNGITLSYSSFKATTAQLQNGFTTIVTASAAGVPSAKLTLNVLKPAVPFDYTTTDQPQYVALLGNTVFVSGYTSNTLNIIANGNRTDAPATYPFSMTVTADGNVWCVEMGSGLGVAYPQGGFFGYDSGAYTWPSYVETFGITTGPDGALWLTETQPSAAIFRLAVNGTSVGAVTRYPLPRSGAAPEGISVGPDGALWFAEGSGYVGRIPVTATPNSSAQIKEYAVSKLAGAANPPSPSAIVTAKDGTLWFTDTGEPVIRRITTTGTITAYVLPNNHLAAALAVAPDGALWFTEQNGYIGRILPTATPANPNVVEFTPADGTSSVLGGIAVAPDGSVYYVENATKAVVQMQ